MLKKKITLFLLKIGHIPQVILYFFYISNTSVKSLTLSHKQSKTLHRISEYKQQHENDHKW